MSREQTTPKLNRRDRRRLSKLGAERMAEEDARPEWVKVASRPGRPASVVCIREDVG